MTEHFDDISPVAGAHQLGEDGFAVPVDSPILPPALPPQYANEGFQISVAQQVEEQRRQLAQPAGNVFKGAPHFLRNVNGEEVCGQCGDAFPCESYRAITDQQALDQATPVGGTGLLTPPTMAEAAAAAGVDPTTFAERLRAFRGL